MAENQQDTSGVISTLIGGEAWDAVYAVDIDSAGAVYLAGETASVDFPISGSIGNDQVRGSDVFLIKMTPDLTQVEFAIALGGGSIESVYGMAVENGVVYLAGETWSSDFPGGFAPQGESDIWVAAIAADGSGMKYAVRIGGIDQDRPGSLVVSDGYVYLTGITWSADFPSSGYKGEGDVFVLRLNPDGSTAQAALFGGANTDAGFDIDIHQGRVLVCGQTWSRFFPIQGLRGQDDGFVMQLDESLNLLGGVLVGGTEHDSFAACTYAADGGIMAAGETQSVDIPNQEQAPGGGLDGLIARVSLENQIEAINRIGGIGADRILGLDIDQDDSVWLTGSTSSSDFPVTEDAFQSSLKGNIDAILVNFDGTASVAGPLYASLLGGSADDYGQTVIARQDGAVLIGGYTHSSDFPVYQNAVGGSISGSQDGFAVQLGAPGSVVFPTATRQAPFPTGTPAPTLSEEQIAAAETSIVITGTALFENQQLTSTENPSPTETAAPPVLTESPEKPASTEALTFTATSQQVSVPTAQSENGVGGSVWIFWVVGLVLLLGLAGGGWYLRQKSKKTEKGNLD